VTTAGEIQFLKTLLRREVNKLQPDFPEFVIKATLNIATLRDRYRPVVDVSCMYRTQVKGGTTYITGTAESLQDIATEVYGDRTYWTAIFDANPVLNWSAQSKGPLLIECMKLTIPKMHVPSHPRPRASKEKNTDPLGSERAVSVAFPTVEIPLEKVTGLTIAYPVPGGVMTGTFNLKGSLIGRRRGTIPLKTKFSVAGYMTSVKATATPFAYGFGFGFNGDLGSVTITNKISKDSWKTDLSISPPNAVKITMAPNPVTFRSGEMEFEGKVGIEVGMRFVPSPPTKWVRVKDWISDNGKVIVFATAAAAIIVVVTVDPIPGDEIAGYSLAAELLGRTGLILAAQ